MSLRRPIAPLRVRRRIEFQMDVDRRSLQRRAVRAGSGSKQRDQSQGGYAEILTGRPFGCHAAVAQSAGRGSDATQAHEPQALGARRIGGIDLSLARRRRPGDQTPSRRQERRAGARTGSRGAPPQGDDDRATGDAHAIAISSAQAKKRGHLKGRRSEPEPWRRLRDDLTGVQRPIFPREAFHRGPSADAQPLGSFWKILGERIPVWKRNPHRLFDGWGRLLFRGDLGRCAEGAKSPNG